MISRILGLVGAFVCAAALSPTAAVAGNCTPPCANVEASVKPTSVIPNPEDATVLGEVFTGPISVLNVSGDASREIKLNFGFQIGSQTYTSLFVNENGLVSFGSPIGASPGVTDLGFQQVDSLTELGIPVIAPFYADLLSSPEQTDGYIGNVVVQYGTADPYRQDGVYLPSQFQNAVRITWFGVTNNGPVNNGAPVYAQLLLAGNDKGTSSFEFSYGPPGNPGQAGDGSIAGFALGADAYQFTGPYTNGVPTYFELDNGRLVGSLARTAVPEPGTWLQILFGFAILAAFSRQRLRTAKARRLI